MANKYFPIETNTACRLKWAWSTVYLTTGKTASCHRSSIGTLNKENFFNFHNLPEKIKARQEMLEGNWPGAGCEYCKNIEDSGGYSDRNFQNTIPFVYPQELNTNPKLTNINPVILEVFFNNTCNLSCLYCNESFSSSIQKENKKFGSVLLDNSNSTLTKNNYNELAPLMWEWLDKNFEKLHRLHILGGEPFIQADFERLIEFINTHPNPKLELSVITNLIVKPANLRKSINSLEQLYKDHKIKRLDILCSVDSWGPEQEYVRYGFDCDIFDSNFNYLLQFDFLRLSILSTVNSLSITSMPLLAEKFVEWNKTKPISWYMHLTLPIDQHLLSASAFEYSLWEPYLEKVKEYLIGDSFDIENTRQTLNGICKTLSNNTTINKHELQVKLVAYLDAIDSRRNLNWQKTFPWLSEVLKNVLQ